MTQGEVLRPLEHHEGVVHADAIHLIDAAGSNRIVLTLVVGTLRSRADRRECAGQREHGDALAGKNVLARHVLPAIRIVAANALVADAAFEELVGNTSADHQWTPTCGCAKRSCITRV